MLRDFVTLTQKQAEERGSVSLKARERSDKPKVRRVTYLVTY